MGTELKQLLLKYSRFFKPVFKLVISVNSISKTQEESVFCKEYYYPLINCVCIHSFKLNFPCK